MGQRELRKEQWPKQQWSRVPSSCSDLLLAGKPMAPANPLHHMFSSVTSHLWARFLMMNLQGLVTLSPGEPHGKKTLGRQSRGNSCLPSFFAAQAMRIPTYSLPQMLSFALYQPPNQPRWLSGLSATPRGSLQPVPGAVWVLAPARMLDTRTGNSQAATGIFDVLKALN